MFDAISYIKRAIDSCVSSAESCESGPNAASKQSDGVVDFILLDCPAAVRFHQFRVVEEIVAEDVLFAGGQIDFIALLAWAQVHVRLQVSDIRHLQTTVGLILLHIAKIILPPGADGHDLALTLDGLHHVAQSLLFGQTACGET